MNNKINKLLYGAVVALAVGTLPACKKNFTDPNNASDQVVFTSTRGITGVAIGLQRTYTAGRASSLFNRVTTDGFITRQFFIVNRGNVPEDQLERGGGFVDGTNTILAGLWTSSNKIIFDANNVIEAANGLGDKGYAAGLIGYATIFKALALGDMAMFWEQVPAGIGNNVSFKPRVEGFREAITAIDAALTAIQANAITTSFTSAIPAGIDIPNTLRALKARYALFAGDFATANTTAASVSLTARSVFTFNGVNQNPIFETATATNNVYQPIDSTMGLPAAIAPDLTDQRVPFYISVNPTIAPRHRIRGFAREGLTEWPIFVPGEILLIRAECLVRQQNPDLPGAQALLNQVLNKTTDLYGVGANLPSITTQLNQADLLTQIYRNRCIELFMSGLKLEDMRRFGRPNSERGRNLMPYPFRERDNNPNTPADPAF
ncbi:MAG: RagB/SusD family nutrient uptake outer membrane protein [Chitinophagaceae bacterium]|nr:RagB/SusD family nutrient uptake outer membrane protein [Chitinophagaceae bacterium]